MHSFFIVCRKINDWLRWANDFFGFDVVSGFVGSYPLDMMSKCTCNVSQNFGQYRSVFSLSKLIAWMMQNFIQTESSLSRQSPVDFMYYVRLHFFIVLSNILDNYCIDLNIDV